MIDREKHVSLLHRITGEASAASGRADRALGQGEYDEASARALVSLSGSMVVLSAIALELYTSHSVDAGLRDLFARTVTSKGESR